MEFRISVTIAELGRSDEIAERVLDSLLERYAETGPIVTQNTSTGHLTITIAIDATDPWAAANFGAGILGDGLDRVGTPEAPVIDLTVSAVEYEDSAENVRELVPA